MRMDADQRKKAEQNIGLVYKVLSDRLHGVPDTGMAWDDLFQAGCIGLCKAAATDKGGTFSTYAYRLIWNEVCDDLARAGRWQKREAAAEDVGEKRAGRQGQDGITVTSIEEMIGRLSGNAAPSTRKGIQAMVWMSRGYTSREVGEQMGGAAANLVCAWVSKARKFLREQPELVAVAAEYGYGIKGA